MTSGLASPLPSRARAYVDAVIEKCGESGNAIVSVILFGSVATGGFSEAISDVDLILVVRDDADEGYRSKLREDISGLEILHGFGEAAERHRTALESFFERVTANHRSLFICNRTELLSGNLAKLLNVSVAQAAFVDRIVLLSILSCAATVWGENLLADVAAPPIRRFDTLKAFWGISNQVVVTALLFPMLPEATRYAMGALKASVHSCFFCHNARRASLEQEIDFFLRRYGRSDVLEQLLRLRRVPGRSFSFVVRCLPELVRLHALTFLKAEFRK